MARRYTQEQLASILQRAGASSWQGVLDYLARQGDATPPLSHDQRAELEEDLEKLKDRDEAFVADAAEAYRIIDALQPERTTIGPGSPTPLSDIR